MKIYFACSIRGGREDAKTYATLAQYIKTKTTLLTEIFADGKLTAQGMNKPNRTIWETDTTWVREADAVIAEVSNPSLGVGYEIAKAEEWGKPVLALYRASDDRRLSAMIEGSPHTTTAYYATLAEAQQAIDSFIEAKK
jgi:2'-deoxynucleoside 5'-phosphate N-hydrolase